MNSCGVEINLRYKDLHGILKLAMERNLNPFQSKEKKKKVSHLQLLKADQTPTGKLAKA